MKTVLVTGANGHLGYNLVKLLKERGYSVKAGVREPDNLLKTTHLTSLNAEIVYVDILKLETLISAMDGVEGVFHAAAPYNITSKNPAKEVKEPIIMGTANVLKSVRDKGVKKLIYTSSTVAVGNDSAKGMELTEKDWNKAAIEPYARAKTEAEKNAWGLADKYQINMVTVLPSAMLGPYFYRHTPTTQSIEELMRGKIPFILPLFFNFVDVRDVALAHVLAYENDKSSGRYIASTFSGYLKELFYLIREIDPEIAIPAKILPKPLLKAVPIMDWLSNRLMKTPRFTTRLFIKEYGGKEPVFSSDRIQRELDWKPMDFKESVRDTILWVRKQFLK